MGVVQWIVTAGTAIFVALVGFFQWRTGQQKAALDHFNRRYEIYTIVRNAVGQIMSSSIGFDQKREIEFIENKELAYFFFGDDVQNYLDELWDGIITVRNADSELGATNDPVERKRIIDARRKALDRIGKFHRQGKPLFARYMRFSQRLSPVASIKAVFDYLHSAIRGAIVRQ